MAEGQRILFPETVEAIKRVEEHANKNWFDTALYELHWLAIRNETLTADDVEAALDKLPYVKTHEKRAMGAVFQRAKKQGWIRPAGFKLCERPNQHNCPKRIWESLIYIGLVKK